MKRTNKASHFFQYETWKTSLESMYLIDGFFIVIIAVFFQIWTSILLSDILNVQPEIEKFETLLSQYSDPTLSDSQRLDIFTQLRTQVDVIIPLSERAFSNVDRSMFIFVIVYFYLIRHIMEVIFSKVGNKVVEIFTVEKLFTFIGCFVFCYSQIRWFTYHRDIDTNYPELQKLFAVQSIQRDEFLPYSVAAGIIIGLQWTRVFFILRIHKVFGPLIEIIMAMIKELFIFGFISVAILLIFTVIGTLMFFEISEFDSFENVLLFLFKSLLGDFDYDVFANNTTFLDRNYGYIYLTSFLILSAIVLLNFLIAILSDVYVIWKEFSSSMYLRQIIRVKQYMEGNDMYCSCLIAAVVPINIFILPFVPFILIKKSKKLNSFLMMF